jgi:hypothetical protein
MSEIRTLVRAHERKLWWAFLAASIVVGALRRPACWEQTPWWAYLIPVALFVGMFAWMRWTFRVRPRRRAAAGGDVDAYVKTAIRGKRIQYVASTDTSVVVYTHSGDLVIEANVEFDHERATDADLAVLDRLDVGSSLSVELR